MNSKLFFRIDDLGWHQEKFMRVLELFKKYGHKLNAEAIPLNCLEHNQLGTLETYKQFLQVHCHGLSHLDHQNAGKKAEFGSQRKAESVMRDLIRAQEILRELFPQTYYPIFTPPWNRIDESFLPLLVEAGFKAISRDGDKQSKLRALPDINADIDLHTRKDQRVNDLTELLMEMEAIGKRQKRVGVMLHHKPMTPADLEFLEELLASLSSRGIKTYFMSELL